MSNQTTTADHFQDGDRVVCADGVARTVRGMAPQSTGAPAHVVVEDGTEWIAANCRRANPEDVAAARNVSNHTAARIRQAPDAESPQWRAALADLTAAMDYLKAAETDRAVLAAIADGAASAARDLAEITAPREASADAPAADDEETALREEIGAHFTVLSHDGHAHTFRCVRPDGASFPVAWTYRTGYGSAARYGWVTSGGRVRGEVPVEYRWQAENAAKDAARLTAGDPSPLLDAFAATPMDELREALDKLRDRATRTRGTAPRHVLDDDVRDALAVLAACHFAEVPRDFNPQARYGADDHDWNVTGLVVEPAGDGRVTAYWVERGQYVTQGGAPFMAELREMRRKFQAAGWVTLPGTRRVVTAYRPTT